MRKAEKLCERENIQRVPGTKRGKLFSNLKIKKMNFSGEDFTFREQ